MLEGSGTAVRFLHEALPQPAEPEEEAARELPLLRGL
jgi:hypothetical protein